MAEATTSSARVRVGVCLQLRASQAALPCVCLEDGCPHSCVLGVVVLRVTVPVSELPVVSLRVGVSVLQGCGSV